jgi:hypothetical protein
MPLDELFRCSLNVRIAAFFTMCVLGTMSNIWQTARHEGLVLLNPSLTFAAI